MKIKYIDEDDMHLVVGLGDTLLIVKGEIKEFPEEMANQFLRDMKTILIEKKKPNKGKPAEYEVKKIPKWELVKEKKEGK
ncbi:unnamed protein product [marine sediment metagenome]|uniref:Uncharacterized protein n=1 Tax=marine sediment metagenome TaxID=412755 RepID=X1DLF4_9ZZZZ